LDWGFSLPLHPPRPLLLIQSMTEHQAAWDLNALYGTGGGDQIEFASNLAGTTIVLTEGQLVISTALEIHGPTAGSPHGLTIDANSQSRAFDIVGGESASESIEVQLTGLTITGGRTSASGAAIHTGLTWSDVVLDDLYIADNSSTAGSGGGIFSLAGSLSLNRVVMEGNSSSGAGGAIRVNATTLQINDSSLIRNSTSSSEGGGALAVQFNSTSIVNSTISGNIASNESSTGGGIAMLSIAGINLVHSTVAFNQAGVSGHAIYAVSGSSFNVTNSLIVQADSEETACAGDMPIDSSNSLATDASCLGPGSVATPALIGLQPLADNGGPTPTHGLNANSIAVNSIAACINDPETILDQRGQPRPAVGSAGDACDVGAFEFQHPRMTLMPQTLAFGTVVIGEAAEPLELNVAVQGDDAVIVSDISGLADPFLLHSVEDCMEGLQFIVQPGGNCLVQIGFSPTAIGTFQQQPVFQSNAVSGTSFQIEGRGVESDEVFTDRFEE
jgi:hypothetical protein